MKRMGWITVAAVMLSVLLIRPVQAVELDLKGKSAFLMDVATGTVLYEKNAHEPLAPASVTKVMTMLLIMEAVDSGKMGWEDKLVTINNGQIGELSQKLYDTLYGIQSGEVEDFMGWTVAVT